MLAGHRHEEFSRADEDMNEWCGVVRVELSGKLCRTGYHDRMLPRHSGAVR